jgi:hypothetical protein
MTSDVSYDDAGEYHFHSWSASTSAVVEVPGEPAHEQRLYAGAGEGRGGAVGWPLVRGSHAAAIVVPTEDNTDGSKLFPLRSPCPR